MTYQTPMPADPVQPAQAPQSVKLAKLLMYAGAVLSLLSAFIGPPSNAEMKKQIIKDDPNVDLSTLDTVVNAGRWFVIIVAVLAALVWLWMAMANGKGKSWARIVATVLFGLATLNLIAGFVRSSSLTGIGHVLNVLMWLVGAGAIFFLWKKESSDFIAAQSRK